MPARTALSRCRSRHRLVVPLVLATTLLAACSGSDEEAEMDPVEAARQAGAEAFDVDVSDVDAGEPLVLAPSECTLVKVGRANVLDEIGRGVIVLPDGSTVIGGTDEAYGEAAAACFVEAGLVPEPEIAAEFALGMARMQGPVTLLDETRGPRVLERLGADWEPPTVSELDDGFAVVFYAQNPETSRVVRVTTTMSIDGASTTNEQIG